ncbi:MAG TPA: hypothetical protein VFP48_04440 [Steroidobacteraceae bacterium]|nr:hypothetical protein [Steroidobacteraceae bacterium]
MNENQATPAAAPPPTGVRPPRRSFKSYLWGALVAAVLLVVLYTAFMLWFSYSEGERAGVLQKFSKRGWVCKTYEGELALYVVGGIAPQIWHFSVRDEAIADQLHKAVGRQVRIHYEEHRGLPTDCFGETDYFASQFEVMGPPTPVQPSAATNLPPDAPAPSQ